MGFVYGVNPLTGRQALCCDFCDHCLGENGENGQRIKWVQKLACPYGYCQHWATCNQCYSQKKQRSISSCGFDSDPVKDKELRKNHVGCKLGHIESLRQQEEENKILEAGHAVRKSALIHSDNMVKVIFMDKARRFFAYFMNAKIYDSISLNKPATIEDYSKFGQIEQCQNVIISDGEKYSENVINGQ